MTRLPHLQAWGVHCIALHCIAAEQKELGAFVCLQLSRKARCSPRAALEGFFYNDSLCAGKRFN